jgi:GTP-binding protein HflX
LFERPANGGRAVIVHFHLGGQDTEEDLREFRELVLSSGTDVVATVTARRETPDVRTFAGAGKVEEIRDTLQREGGDVVLFNHDLSPVQERNLERSLRCRVGDRTGVILNIFAQRANSFEGKLQVEMAQLRHLSTRLVRGWTHLERQKGGIGLRGGPGETQLEIDRRLLKRRMMHLNEKIERVRQQRGQGRRARQKAGLPAISVIGYTNAGKSTLFNRLTSSTVYAADRLFATLDPTLRRLEISGLGPVILSDTVGFIRHLPHDLVAAFRATLEAVSESDLLVHVIDASSPEREEKVEQVNGVLAEIGAAEVPRIEVYNKIDLIPDFKPTSQRDQAGRVRQVWVSAATGEGMKLLTEAIATHFNLDQAPRWLRLPMTAGRLRARLYSLNAVLNEATDGDGTWLLQVELSKTRLDRLSHLEGFDGQWVAASGQAP